MLDPPAANGDTLTIAVRMQTGTPLVGAEGRFSYPATQLTYVGLQRTDYSQSWDFLSAKADPSNGTIRLGAVPNLHLQNPI